VLMAVAAAAAGAVMARQSRGGESLSPLVPPGHPSRRSHVVLLVMENKERSGVIGTAAARYLTGLARANGLASLSFGVRHPSLPNYIALVSGSTQGITSDCTSCTANALNLADQLEQARRSWTAYLEGLPRPCARPATAGRYAKKHDPLAYDDAIARDAARCRRRVPLSRLPEDIRSDRLADFAFIAPDLCHDTHDCSVATGDRFLARLIPGLISALGPHGFLIITYDEGTSDAACCGDPGGGRIPTVLVGPDVRAGALMRRPIDHYGILRTIETAFALPKLGAAGSSRHGSLDALFRDRAVPLVTSVLHGRPQQAAEHRREHRRADEREKFGKARGVRALS
jgi:phosphatidylinositol-3-phosphatase